MTPTSAAARENLLSDCGQEHPREGVHGLGLVPLVHLESAQVEPDAGVAGRVADGRHQEPAGLVGAAFAGLLEGPGPQAVTGVVFFGGAGLGAHSTSVTRLRWRAA